MIHPRSLFTYYARPPFRQGQNNDLQARGGYQQRGFDRQESGYQRQGPGYQQQGFSYNQRPSQSQARPPPIQAQNAYSPRQREPRGNHQSRDHSTGYDRTRGQPTQRGQAPWNQHRTQRAYFADVDDYQSEDHYDDARNDGQGFQANGYYDDAHFVDPYEVPMDDLPPDAS